MVSYGNATDIYPASFSCRGLYKIKKCPKVGGCPSIVLIGILIKLSKGKTTKFSNIGLRDNISQ